MQIFQQIKLKDTQMKFYWYSCDVFELCDGAPVLDEEVDQASHVSSPNQKVGSQSHTADNISFSFKSYSLKMVPYTTSVSSIMNLQFIVYFGELLMVIFLVV